MKKRQNRKGDRTEKAKNRNWLNLLNKFARRFENEAYEFFELHGQQDGSDVDDWLKGESEVTRKG